MTLRAAASQICLQGAGGVNLDKLAQLSGLGKEDFRRLYPTGTALFLSAIESTGLLMDKQLQEDLVGATDPAERFLRAVTSGLTFAESNPELSQMISVAMFSNDLAIRECVEHVYERLFTPMAEELIRLGIGGASTWRLTTDITPLLLSLFFLGSCPDLQMDYVAMVDYRRTAMSLLKALRVRFATPGTGQ